MKRNKYVTKIVAGTVATSILANSCTPALIGDNSKLKEEDAIYLKNANSNDWGDIAIPISFNLHSEDANYMFFLQKLAMDIINDPQTAQKFMENPAEFLDRYDCNIPINLDEETLKLVLALGDPDINDAIKNNDVSLFLDLCKEKDLFVSNDNAFSHLYNDPEIQAKLIELGITDLEIVKSGVCVAAIVFAVTIIATAAFVVYVVAYCEVAVEGVKTSNIVRGNQTLNSLRQINPILTVLALKGNSNLAYIAASELAERQTDEVVNFIKSENPSYFKNNSESNLRALLKLNAF